VLSWCLSPPINHIDRSLKSARRVSSSPTSFDLPLQIASSLCLAPASSVECDCLLWCSCLLLTTRIPTSQLRTRQRINTGHTIASSFFSTAVQHHRAYWYWIRGALHGGIEDAAGCRLLRRNTGRISNDIGTRIPRFHTTTLPRTKQQQQTPALSLSVVTTDLIHASCLTPATIPRRHPGSPNTAAT
jgi:hypothetical protein